MQDFQTIILVILLVYKQTFSGVFYWMKSVRVPSQFSSLFIRYISTAKSISLVRVYIEIKINKHEI